MFKTKIKIQKRKTKKNTTETRRKIEKAEFYQAL
jgi:hypothetical protein